MIPHKLVLEGIYSYQTRQEIDFTNLSSEHLFGIFGPVGSGKSAILEAITLALYGETERLHQRDNRQYNMMNLKSNELFIDFQFRGGKEHRQMYAFTVRGQRDRSAFESVKSFQRAGYRIDAGQRIPLDVKTAEEIIGLSYENFRRTIIIPQGQFQEFLQLTEADRTKMLKEIFNLHRYDLQSKTMLIENANKEQLSHVEGQLAEIGPVTEDHIARMEKDLGEAITLQTRIDKELKIKQDEEKAQQSLSELFAKLDKQFSIVADLEKQKPIFERREKTLQEYELCVQQFKDILEQESTQRDSLSELRKSLEENRESFKKLNADLAKKKMQVDRVKKQYEGREALKEESEDLGVVLKVRELADSINALSKSVQRNEEQVTNATEKIAKLDADLKANKAQLIQKKKELPDQKALSEVQKWFTNRNNLVDQRDQAKKSLKSAELELKELNESKIALLKREGLNEFVARKHFSLEFDELAEKLGEAKKSLKSDLKKCEEEIQHKEVQKHLGEYVESLEPGKPCPVCGATDHPNVIVVEGVDQELKALRKMKSDLDNSIETVEQAIRDLGKIGTKHAKVAESLRASTATLNEFQKKLEKHLEEFHWRDFDPKNEGKVDEEFDRAERLKGQIERLEETISVTEKKIEETQTSLERARSILEKEKRELASLGREHATRIQQLRRKSFEEYEHLSNAQVKSRITELNNEYRDIEKAYNQLEREINELSKSVNTLQGKIEGSEKHLDAVEESYKRTVADIEKRVASSGVGSLANVQKVLKSGLDPKRERKQIEEFKQTMHSSSEKLRELQADAEGQSYDKKLHARLKDQIDSLQKSLKEQNENVGKLKSKVKELQTAFAKRVELEKERTRLQKRGMDIDLMKSLFRGNGFVNYVSTVYLRNVCQAANVRFSQLTRQKLRLELNKDNTFHVRDFMNDGKIRSAKTLSGGQLFQASLSLALALGDQIQQLAEADQNFFFLDEGFGSLDKDSLQTVFETLASLRKENRVIGIISHVDELQQEITTHLKVRNTEERGSVIETSWV